MKIIVASKNPVKIQAASDGFAYFYPGMECSITGESSISGVSDQPMTDAETLLGAQNRMEHVRAAHPDADFWVGIEGGLHPSGDTFEVFAWVVIADEEHSSSARTGMFMLPPPIAELIRAGHELGDADDIIFGRNNSKQDNGAIGILTGNLITRRSYYVPAVIMALIPFKNPELYFV